MSNLYFQICALIFLTILMVVYFSKERINNIETKVFSSLLILAAISLGFDFAIVLGGYFDWSQNVIIILNRFYLSFLLVWVYMFTFYIVYISMMGKNQTKNVKAALISLSIILVITILLIFICPLYLFKNSSAMFSYGPSINVLCTSVVLYTLIILISIIINIKNVISKKYVPVFVLVFLVIIMVIINRIDPSLLLTTFIITVITFLMYFTIENPDVKMIAQLNFERDRADKANNAKTEFLSSMSHEIRTPLNAIVGFSQALKEEDLPESAQDEVQDILTASDTLLEIVNSILDISKIEANKVEIIETEYSFKKVFDDLVSLSKARINEKPIDFRVVYDESIPSVLYGDASKLKQVILNLLTNAIKYTKEGFVEFRVSSVVVDGICRLIVAVEDSGIGIKPEKIDKLFTKFDRLEVEKSTTVEGTGLGLAITKKLLDLMGGIIVVQSVYGSGSKFTVSLDQKIVEGKVLTEEKEEVVKEAQDYTGKKILIVDDNTLNIKVASRLLQEYKVSVSEATSGQECLDKINNKEEYDLILLDDMMPNMSGTETFAKLKEIDGFDIPVIALTANAIEGMKEKYLSLGFNDYLAKPIDRKELNRVIVKYLSK